MTIVNSLAKIWNVLQINVATIIEQEVLTTRHYKL